jgi:hypothetical protein
MALTWDDLRARGMACLRCRSTFPIAGPLSQQVRDRVVARLRRDGIAEVVVLIRDGTGCSLVEAKGTSLHLVRKAGECHRCGGTIRGAELVDCPHCEALNIFLEAAPSP